MKKFLLGLVVGGVLTVMAGIIIAFSVARLSDRKPAIADSAVLVLKLSGDFPEKPAVDVPFPFGSSTVITTRDFWSMMKSAASDSRIKAVVLMPDGIGVGWGRLQEMREDLVNFKKSGKPLIAFLNNPKMREYYLATAADQVYMAPEDLLDVKGLRAELMFFKKTLDKVGAEFEVYHVGKYKDAGDMLTQTSATPETMEVMNSVLDTMYGHLIDTFAASRKKKPEEIRSLIDDGPFLAKKAVAGGLIDGLKYEDEMYGEVEKRVNKGELKKVSYNDYLRGNAPAGTDSRNKIAFVVGEGDIVKGRPNSDSLNDQGFTEFEMIKELRRVESDSDVKGVILRINSPGGDAIASDDILREVKNLSAKKPLVISMSDLAASGGYYVSMTGDPMIAYPGTYTGSIGIIFGKLNIRGLYDKLGVTKDVVMRGRNADLDSDYHALTESGRAKLTETLNDFYHDFVAKAAQARKRKYEEIDNLAQGRVWLGVQAKNNGLIDEVGGLDKAVEMIKKKAHIPDNENVRLVPYPAKRSIFEQFLKQGDSGMAEAALRREVQARVQGLLGGVNIDALQRGGYLRTMPYNVKVE